MEPEPGRSLIGAEAETPLVRPFRSTDRAVNARDAALPDRGRAMKLGAGLIHATAHAPAPRRRNRAIPDTRKDFSGLPHRLGEIVGRKPRDGDPFVAAPDLDAEDASDLRRKHVQVQFSQLV
jgi:hypothetical protein